MTVPSDANRSGPYNGNGSTTIFGYGFRIVDEDHLRVIKTSALGVETTLAIDADYIVSDVGNPGGGQIAVMVAPRSGETITILRDVPFTQDTDLENQGAYYAETVEDALDIAAMRDQQLIERLGRTVSVPAAFDDVDVQLPAPEANSVIAWDADAKGLQNITPGELISIAGYGDANSDIFTGNGARVDFELSSNPGGINNLDVSIGGVTQVPGIDYRWSGGRLLSFMEAPADGAVVLARYMQGLPAFLDIDALAEEAAASAASAREDAASAALSSAVAESAAGPTYPNTTSGLAATSSGQSFAVSNGNGTVTVYLNSAGVAVAQRTLFTTEYAAGEGGAEAIGLAGGGTVQEMASAFSATTGGVFSADGSGKKVFFRRAQAATVNMGLRGSRYWCCVPRASRSGAHYLLFEMRRANLTPSGSVGGNAELLRVTSVLKVASAWIGRHDYSSISDAAHWPATAYTVAGNAVLYQHLQTVNEYYSSPGAAGTGGRWIEFNVPFNGDGEANLQFLSTPGSANDAEISIDGGPAEVARLASTSAQIYRHKLRASPGFHTVRVTKPTALSTINVFGTNYGDVASYPGFSSPGGFCAWGDGTAYTNDEGASDYAILDQTSGLFAGSFHGGEVLQAEDFIIDGIKVNPLAAIVSCDTLEIIQKTQIDWPSNASPTSSLICHSSQTFAENNGYSMSYVFSENPAVPGGVQSRTFYTAMHTTPERFTDVVAPEYLNLIGQPDGFKALSRSDVVVQSSPGTGERIVTQIALDNLDYLGNIYGGPTVRKVSGSYNKLYYGPLISAPAIATVKRMRGGFRKRFAG